MSLSFSTDLIRASDRLEAWRYNAKQVCGDCRFQFPKIYAFHGQIERRKVAGLELTRFSSSPLSFSKFPAVSLRSDDRCCIVITQLEGVRRYSQNGTVAILKPQDTTLIDSGVPWTSDCPGECSRLYLRIPRGLVESRLRFSSLPIARRICGASGLGATLFGLATSLYHEADMLTAEEGIVALEAYLEILSTCIGRPEPALRETSHCGELSSRIENFIEMHLPEPTLCPAEIAAAIGISVRHLHRLFMRKGRTVADWIRERRLRECRSDLADSRMRERTITEIAFFWGFNDSAHFSRSFKKQFGICPTTFRARKSANSWNAGRGRVSGFYPAVESQHSQPN
jgi:AraC family transcriptional regulator, positive regulator of tynA and feaB